MFEKRKNSDNRGNFSLVSTLFTLAFLIAGIFIGLELSEKTQSDAVVIQEAIIEDVNISGVWIGTSTQDYNDNLHYDYRVVIQQNGDVIKGVAHLDMIGGREAYSEERIEGYIDGNTIFYQEQETLELVNTDPNAWCLTESTLTYQILNGQETLVGEWVLAAWERPECGEITGRIILTRAAE